MVSDVHDRQLAETRSRSCTGTTGSFFSRRSPSPWSLRSQSADPAALSAAAQKAILAITPDQPISDVKTMRAVISDNVAQPRFYTLLLAIFAAIALVLAATGLYGVLSYSVSRRVREIGIRMALGASRGTVFRLVVLEALGLVGTGILLGRGRIAGAHAPDRVATLPDEGHRSRYFRRRCRLDARSLPGRRLCARAPRPQGGPGDCPPRRMKRTPIRAATVRERFPSPPPYLTAAALAVAGRTTAGGGKAGILSFVNRGSISSRLATCQTAAAITVTAFIASSGTIRS